MLFVTTRVNLKGIMLSEISQPQKEKCCLTSLRESEIVKYLEAQSRMVAARNWGGSEWGGVG